MTAKKKETNETGNQFYGWATVSTRGQIAIPNEVRNTLDIKDGDRLLIIIRKDKDGINLIKSESLGKVFEKFSK